MNNSNNGGQSAEDLVNMLISGRQTIDGVLQEIEKRQTQEKLWDDMMNAKPVDFHLSPMHDHLIMYFLYRKIEGQELPSNRIHQADGLLHLEPEVLAERYKSMGDGRWYFFTQREVGRLEENGCWQPAGAERVVAHEFVQIGYRRKVYRQMKQPEGPKNWWVMQIYRARKSAFTPQEQHILDKMVLCKLVKKDNRPGMKRRSKAH